MLDCLPFDNYKDCKFLMVRRRAVSRCFEIHITFAGKNKIPQTNQLLHLATEADAAVDDGQHLYSRPANS